MRVALFGSPAFAVPTLEALHAAHEVALVVTQPARPAGRGLELRQPAAAQAAHRLGLDLAQPARLRGNDAFAEALAALELDVAVTAAYGKILPPGLLELPRHGFLNVHASLLPAYRGAAPIQWALIDGRTETGVTILQTEAGLDTGPIRLVRRYAIAPDAVAEDLFRDLAVLGADAIVEALARLDRGDLPSAPQDETEATLAPLLSRDDGRIRWGDPATAIVDRWRGVHAWPGSHFEHRGRTVKALELRLADPVELPAASRPGEIASIDAGGVVVATGEGAVRLERVQPAGRGAMAARAWANGYQLAPGDRVA